MGDILEFILKLLLDNRLIPVQFGLSAGLALFGLMALNNSEEEDTLHSIGWGLITAAGIGIFATAINYMGG